MSITIEYADDNPVSPDAVWREADATWPVMNWLPSALNHLPVTAVAIQEFEFIRWFRIQPPRPSLEERVAALEAWKRAHDGS